MVLPFTMPQNLYLCIAFRRQTIPPLSDVLWLNKLSRRQTTKCGKHTSLAFISYLKAVNKRPSNQQDEFSGLMVTRVIS